MKNIPDYSYKTMKNIPEDLLQAIINYMARRPYHEVYTLMESLNEIKDAETPTEQTNPEEG